MTNEELAIRIQAGEQGLMTELWERNIGFFRMKSSRLFMAQHFYCKMSGVELDDILQLCYLALCDAVRMFRPDGGYKFISYIKFPLMNHFRAIMGIKSSKRDMLNQAVSLDKPLSEDGGETLLELLPDPNSDRPFEAVIIGMLQSELRNSLEMAISKLPERRAAVIRGRYFDGKTSGELADEMKVSKESIQQIEARELYKLYRDHDLQKFQSEVLSRWAYRRTGLGAFRRDWTSSVERAVIRAEEAGKGRANTD